MKKIISIIGLILFVHIVSCDYFKSQEISQEKKFELAQKCSKAGMEYFKSYYIPEGYLWDEPEYHYNSRLNKCLINIRYIKLETKSSLSLQCNQVIDIFENRPIIYGWFERDAEKHTETLKDPPRKDIHNYTSVEYFKRKHKLFSE